MSDTTLANAMPATDAMNVALARLAADTPERKRSVVLAGHRTSVSVEPLFWNELRRVAVGRGQSRNGLVTESDRYAGATGSLSSALRVFVLDQTRGAG